jgi:acetolactate synthase-1/2/3 large subunit
MDSIPMVAITGNVSTQLLGKDSFQEVDLVGVTMPITKHNFIVKDITKLADTIRRAFYIAQEGRPGPVLVDITKDVTALETDYTSAAPKPIPRKTKFIRTRDVDKALELINHSKKPMVLGGGGIVSSEASEEFIKFAELIDSPVALTIMGLGGFPSSNERYLGMIGMHGCKASNLSVMECDLIICIGMRFSDRVTGKVSDFARKAKILHIDIDPAEVNKNTKVTGAIVGDIKEVLLILNKRMTQQKHTDWMEEVYAIKNEHPVNYDKNGLLKPQYVIEKIRELTKGEAIITTDVGQHQMFACQFAKPEKPRHFITSGGLGTMGFGLGASIGASLANPDKTVFNITGDGCFRMNNIELGTAVEYKVPVIVVIMNNHVLGMVRQWQSFFYDSRYSHTTFNDERKTDFVKLAEAYGAAGFTITKNEEVEEVIKKAIALRKTVVINVEIGPDDKVFPMVPAGVSIDEFVSDDAGAIAP